MVVDKVTGCGYTAVAGHADTATTSTIKNCKDGDVLHFTGNYLQHAGVRLRPLCDGWHASDICRNMRSFRHSLILLVVTFKSGYGEGPKCTGVWKKDKQVMCTLGAMDGVYGLWDIYVNDEQTGLQLQGHEPEVTKLGGCLKVSGPLDGQRAILLARGTRLTLGGALTQKSDITTVRTRLHMLLPSVPWTSQPLPALFCRC